MRRIIFSVRDRAAETFGAPFLVTGRGQALRSFQDEINRADAANPLFSHPADFDLYELGFWEDSTGAYDCDGAPLLVLRGEEAKIRGSNI